MDIGAVVLHKVLTEKSLDIWSKLKLAYINPAYASIFAAITKYYIKYDKVPSFEDLKFCTRDQALLRNISALETTEVPEDLDSDILVDALVNQFAQNESLKYLDKFLDNVTIMDVQELKDGLSEIVLKLDEKTMTTEAVYTPAELTIFEAPEMTQHLRFPLGINNTFDSTLGGAYRQELILVGGKRGSGKSLVCSNISCAQYEQGNVSVYFTIEMRASEVFQRNCAILAGVSHQNIRQNNLTTEEVLKLATTRAKMFEGGDEVYAKFLEHQDRYKFEAELCRLPIRKEGQIIIVDDRKLSTTSIDLHLQKLKAQYGDKLTVAIVDYVNQVCLPGNSDIYDWKTQIELSKELKSLARKHDVCLISPMQIDDNNGVRFAKGILDAPDIAFVLNTHEKEDAAITFETIKIRGGSPINFTSGMNWDTLKISAADVTVAPKRDIVKKQSKKESSKAGEDPSDVPW